MSGPGVIDVDFQSADRVEALLSNYDVDKSVLKKEHTQWLEKNVVSILRRGGSIALMGFTSRTASETYNLGLSKRRVREVVRFLRSQVSNNFKVRIEIGTGELLARALRFPNEVENQLFRAVSVIASINPTPPPPPKPVRPKPVILRERIVRAWFMTRVSQKLPSSGDARADRLAELGTNWTQDKYLNSSVAIEVVKERLPANYELIRVFTARRKDGANTGLAMAGLTGCLVVYQWAIPKRPIPYLIHGYWRDGAMSNQLPWLLPLSDYEASGWLNDPRLELKKLASQKPIFSKMNLHGYYAEGLAIGEPPPAAACRVLSQPPSVPIQLYRSNSIPGLLQECI